MGDDIHDIRKIEPLRNRSDFIRLRRGKRYSTSNFTLQADRTNSESGQNHCRIGYTVTNKIGNAVVRNRIKRRLREAVRLAFLPIAQAANDYVIIARLPVLNAHFEEIVRELKLALDHVHRKQAKDRKFPAIDETEQG